MGQKKRHFILAMKSLLNYPTNKKITSSCVKQGAQPSTLRQPRGWNEMEGGREGGSRRRGHMYTDG